LYVYLVITRHCSTHTALTARRSMLIAAAIQPDSLDMVLTRLLASGLFHVLS